MDLSKEHGSLGKVVEGRGVVVGAQRCRVGGMELVKEVDKRCEVVGHDRAGDVDASLLRTSLPRSSVHETRSVLEPHESGTHEKLGCQNGGRKVGLGARHRYAQL